MKQMPPDMKHIMFTNVNVKVYSRDVNKDSRLKAKARTKDSSSSKV